MDGRLAAEAVKRLMSNRYDNYNNGCHVCGKAITEVYVAEPLQKCMWQSHIKEFIQVMIKNAANPELSRSVSRLACVLLATLIAVSLIIPINIQSAYAAPSSAQKQAEADQVSAKLYAYEAEMMQIGEDYRKAVEAHDSATAAMDEAQSRIDAAQSVITDTQGKLGARASSMYRSGPLSFLDVLFGASSFTEFTTNWDILSNINNQNAALIQVNKDARLEAKAAHSEFSAQQQIAAERLSEAESIKARAEENIAAQVAELAGLEAEVAQLVAAEQEARRIQDAANTGNVVNDSTDNGTDNGTNNGTNPNNGSNDGGNNNNPPVDIPNKPVPSGGYPSVVAAAVDRLGCPYVAYPGPRSGPDSFDCSGLTSWCYSQAGLGWIGSSDSSQYYSASARWPYTGPDSAAPGDVLWWPGHVAIYVGGGSYIHAPQPGQYVCYSSWNIGSATVLRF